MRKCAEDLGWTLRWHTQLVSIVRSIHAAVLPVGDYVGTLPELRSEGNRSGST